MTPTPIGPADHALAAAMTALALDPMLGPEDEALYFDSASRVLDRINRDHAPMQRLYLAFVAYGSARRARAGLGSARFDLVAALVEFHRWRLGRAVGALEQAAG